MTDEPRSIPPRPTIYRGCHFRSRLEAKWAAFFDALGWQWEYEPEAFHGWMPDFLLIGPSRSAYVEVKPDYLVDDVSPKVERAMRRLGRDRCVVIVGEAPAFDQAKYLVVGRGLVPDEGWERGDGRHGFRWGDAALMRRRREEYPTEFELYAHDTTDAGFLAGGSPSGKDFSEVYGDDAKVLLLWRGASSAVRWQP